MHKISAILSEQLISNFNDHPKYSLERGFYARNVVEVARDLLGKVLVFDEYTGIITETEAYRGQDDEASHAFKGPSFRTQPMFGLAGHMYVYLIYGMYHCLNFTTEGVNEPSAVLIRGLQLITPAPEYLNGPGKICRKLSITRAHTALDLTCNPHRCVMAIKHVPPAACLATPRIGIKKATDKLWRFVMQDMPSSNAMG